MTALLRKGSMRLSAMLCAAFAVAPTASASAQSTPGPQKLVIAPPGDSIRELFDHPDQWPAARAMTGTILHADHNLNRFNDDELRTWFAMMRTWHITLELEVGAIKEWGPTADATFAAEHPIWDRAIRLGADLGSIVMDEPLSASRFLHKPDAYAVEQTARFIGLVRQRYPTMRIGDVEPYPGLPLVDHLNWLQELQSRLNAQGLTPLDFYRADVDWIAFTKAGRGNWHEVATLAAAVHKSALPFSLIYWASGYPSEKAQGLAGDDTWYIEVMGQGYAVADAGIHPDQFTLESWLDTPSQIVPDDAKFSFTRSVLDFGRKFLRTASPETPPPK
jgi:hypothetical protein